MYCEQINYTKRQTRTKTLYCNCEFNDKFNPCGIEQTAVQLSK